MDGAAVGAAHRAAVTGPAPAVQLLDSTGFGAVFDVARVSVFRFEGHQDYAVAADDADLAAFRSGAPRPERSVRTSPWLRRIAVQTARGVSWSRLRIVRHPLTEYTRFELVAYVESQAAGEQIRLVEAAGTVPEDFWLIDAGTPGAVAVVMHYDQGGRLLGREKVTDPQRIAGMVRVRERLWRAGAPLNVWLAGVARG